MSHRKVVGLREAQLCARPEWLPKQRLRGSQAQGLRYERQVARALPQARYGQWFSYTDANGTGYCSPDLILPAGPWLCVLEVKLTDTPRAIWQLKELYFPVLEKVFNRPIRGAVVARNLWRRTEQGLVVETLAQALAMPAESIPVIHWLGHTPL